MFLPINLKTVHIDRDIALNKLRRVRWLIIFIYIINQAMR